MPLTSTDGTFNAIDFLIFRGEFKEATPITDHQYIEVTFTTPDTDVDIKHDLRPATPEAIDYVIVRADRATSIYHDQSGTRKPWKDGYIILRSSVANAKVKLELRTPRT